MKKILSLIVLSLSLLACSQNTNKPNKMHEINSSNYVEKVLENVKHYPQEPEYIIRIGNTSMYEVFVNDIPIQKHYRESKIVTPIDINYAILKSGTQKISFKLFPYENRAFKKDDGINIRILVRDKKEVEQIGIGRAEEKLLLEKEFMIGENYFSKFFEGSLTFEAKVPYENKGWIDGQDLTKFDKKELENAVVAFYQKMWNIYNDKTKKEELFPLIFNRDREIAISDYSKKEDVNDIFNELMLPYTNKTYEMQPLENYKMVYYGNGKVVALEQTNMDIRLRGESSFWAKYQSEKGTNMMYSTRISLYLPQGKELKDGLEIIR